MLLIQAFRLLDLYEITFNKTIIYFRYFLNCMSSLAIPFFCFERGVKFNIKPKPKEINPASLIVIGGNFMEKTKDLTGEFPSVIDRAYGEYKKHRKIEDIMTTEIVSIRIDATMDEVAKIMGERHIGSLIVENYDTPVGIVTERDLLSKVLAPRRNPKDVKVKDIMSYPLIKICSTAEIKEAAQMMIKKKGRLAIFRCGDLVGIITASDLIRSLPDVPETQLKVDEYMTKQVTTAEEKTSIADIAKIMGEERIGSVIITRKGKPSQMSIFTERDLLTTFLAKEKSLSKEVGEASSSPLIMARLGTTIHKTAAIMTSNHIRRVPISKNGELVGIITARDLVEAYAK
jgi:CBS domain-containing protein